MTSAASRRSRPRTVEPAHGRATLTLTINGDRYDVRPVPAGDPDVIIAWQLRKRGSAAPHVVALTVHGPTCECGDFAWRRAGTGLPCKHLAAAMAVGLLPPPRS